MVVRCKSMEGTKSRMQAINSGASVVKPVVMMVDTKRARWSVGGEPLKRLGSQLTTDKDHRSQHLWLKNAD
jgi:hypothetical protein